MERLLGNPQLSWRCSTLDQHCMLSSLDAGSIEEISVYCAHRFGDGDGEVATCLQAAAHACPDGLRVKELLETFEAYYDVAAFAHDAGKGKPIDTIFDLACGHGMLGVLLAYRFPQRQVVCVDLVKRPIFEALVGAFQEHGEAGAGEARALSNLRFEEADLCELRVPPRAMLVAVHACNDLNKTVLEAARDAGAPWAVMPCCVRAGTYLPCRAGGPLLQENDAQHLLNCGVVAGVYAAERLKAIDRRITNRNVLICGGAGFEDYEDAKQRCSEGPLTRHQ